MPLSTFSFSKFRFISFASFFRNVKVPGSNLTIFVYFSKHFYIFFPFLQFEEHLRETPFRYLSPPYFFLKIFILCNSLKLNKNFIKIKLQECNSNLAMCQKCDGNESNHHESFFEETTLICSIIESVF